MICQGKLKVMLYIIIGKYKIPIMLGISGGVGVSVKFKGMRIKFRNWEELAADDKLSDEK